MKALIIAVILSFALASQASAYWDPCWFTVPWCDLQDN